jgi:hypothetical protein
VYTLYRDWSPNMNHLISASWVSRITVMSHHHPGACFLGTGPCYVFQAIIQHTM